jgi:hypothetical protein
MYIKSYSLEEQESLFIQFVTTFYLLFNSSDSILNIFNI